MRLSPLAAHARKAYWNGVRPMSMAVSDLLSVRCTEYANAQCTPHGHAHK